ncbi:hypothetical protein HanHA300_Chr15g0579471 [Helianthus annuus]|uniref:uncharacterized protein LOC110912321 n=1 Tax=Helianthus annuus TaxID=4232 RepID=UPI0016533D82|nr:uncharacterized protein LOC110912321 [Helianthus annuus]KAJ0452486.1 hypothetical protein HanHA300_Chr15g0579471 [Helianthus annuus]KAJ0457395.1 hypothetical protein HanIR_Chr15g0773261 [Helianthus annuus]KAJ0474386.1 hypothetical protein HanHA89_Chr15g0629111 [Helianthus annuus]KAJ0649951.1 hypothetical protein HanLR1_Chr15g0590111 [Helianthus annuus]KAJ0653735.1 hypothetical protein HanOQP8_Chr15g0586881 [Helianthus annuus]
MDNKCGPHEHGKENREPFKLMLGMGLQSDVDENKLVDYGPSICNSNRQNMADFYAMKEIFRHTDRRNQLKKASSIQFGSVALHLHFGSIRTIQRIGFNFNINRNDNLCLDEQSCKLSFSVGTKIWNKALFRQLDNSQDVEDGETQLLYGPLHVDQIGEKVKYTVNKKWFDVPFDQGSTSQEPCKTSHQVEQSGWVVMIVQKFWVDVPFDPGGFDSKTKLEDEFFSKTGSMMHGYP